MSDLNDVDLSNLDFDAELDKLLNPVRPDFSGDPSDEEWERVNTYRWHVEQFFQKLEPDGIVMHDELVAHYTAQIEGFGLDIYSLRSLYNITLAMGIQQFFIKQSADSCGAGPIMAAHVMEHYVSGSLRFDYILRRALINAGAPAPHAPAEEAPPAE